MPVATAKKIMEIAAAVDDPATAIQKAVGNLDDVQTLYDLVLVGTYIQPEKRKSGLYIPQEAVKEDEYQGVVGLILQMGPDAEKMAEEVNGPKVGDWVVSSTNNGWSLHIRDTACRLVPYDKLRMRISTPKVIYDA